MIAATLVGLAETALELTVTHARSRIQFGAPIGVNQAVRHPCADVATQIEVARAQTLHAALAVDARAPDASYLTACARVLASDVARMSTRTCIQVHGGLGVTDEFPAHRLLKQAAVADRWFGPTEFHLGLLAPTTTRRALAHQDRETNNN
jgi:alkylation response protein AidB-like acyl-CoA dehydrogenase